MPCLVARPQPASQPFLTLNPQPGESAVKLFSQLNGITGLPGPVGRTDIIQLGQVVRQEFFFHYGVKALIRIEIVTRVVDSSFRLELNKMVLKCLRFDGA